MSEINNISVSSEFMDNFKIESESGETAEFYMNTEDVGEYTCYELGNELTKITEYSDGYFCSSEFVLTGNAINILLKKGYPKEELFEITLEVGAKATIAFREVLKEFYSSGLEVKHVEYLTGCCERDLIYYEKVVEMLDRHKRAIEAELQQ